MLIEKVPVVINKRFCYSLALTLTANAFRKCLRIDYVVTFCFYRFFLLFSCFIGIQFNGLLVFLVIFK